MTHKEVLVALLDGKVVKRSGTICDYLYKMIENSIYYAILDGDTHYRWQKITTNHDVFKFYGEFSIYKKCLN